MMAEKEGQAVIIEKFWTPNLNQLCKVIIDGGPTEEEISLLCVLAIMDETMRNLAMTPGPYSQSVMQTYHEVELYLRKEGFEQ